MLDREAALALVRRALALSPSEQTEIVLSSQRSELTRFAANAITQNVSQDSETLSIRLVSGKREGKADTNRFDDAGLRRAIDAAWSVVQLAKEDPLLPPLLDKQPQYRPVEAYSAATAEATPLARAKAVADAIARCKADGLEASGIMQSGADTIAYANSRGVFAFHASSNASFSLTAVDPAASSEGWAMASEHEIDRLPVERLSQVAIDKAKRGRRPEALPPGRYTVVLEPAAAADLIRNLSWLGFGALRWQEGRSYLHAGARLGQRAFSSKLTVRDDAYHPAIRGLPFDFEGTARESLTLIEKGVPRALVWDRRTAAREQNGKRSTGHSLPQPNPWGPVADALVVEGDEKTTTADLVRSTSRGLLVTKLHYVNTVDPMNLSITGMTRAGVFLIEDGEIVRPVKNYRFTVSLLEALSEDNLEALGAPERVGSGFFGGGPCFVPPMKIREFNMSSGTEF